MESEKMESENLQSSIQILEYCDQRYAKWLLDNIDNIKIRESTDINYDPKKNAEKYCREILKSENGLVKRIYNNIDGEGRMFLKNNQIGYQNLMREYRSILACDSYYDLDIKNCQPTILLQYCEKNNIDCKFLKKYVENREEFFKQIMTNSKISKNDIKMEYLKVMYGGKFTKEFTNICDEKIQKFNKFYFDEMNNILLKVSELNKSLLEKIKSKKDFNIYGSCTSYFCQNIENIIIMNAIKFLRNKKFDVGALCFDGLMVRNTLNLTDAIIKKLNTYIKEKTGYTIEFCIKEFEKIVDIPKNELTYVNDTFYIDEDMQATDYLINKINKKVVKCGFRWFIKKNDTNIYEEDISNNFSNVKDVLFKFISSFDIQKNTSFGPKPYSKNTVGASLLLKSLFAHIPDTETFINDLWNSNLSKLCFLNGYYDFKNKIFKPYDNSTYTVSYVNYNYDDNIDKKYIDIVYNKILNPIFFNKEQQKYILNWFSRGLAGHYTEKTWAVGLGCRDSGKGVIVEFLKETFCSYVKLFTAESLLCSNVGTTDEAKKRAFLIPFQFSRLNFSQELKIENENGRPLSLDGTIIKSISSGGDDQRARLNHKDQIVFKIQGRMCLMMNELIKTNPNDCLETLDIFQFQSIFKKNITEDEKIISEAEDTNCKYFEADENIKILIKDENLQKAFIQIIINHYSMNMIPKPDMILNNMEDLGDKNNLIEDQIKQEYIITRQKNDRILRADFNNSLNFSKSKIKLTLNKLGIGEIKTQGLFYVTGIKKK